MRGHRTTEDRLESLERKLLNFQKLVANPMGDDDPQWAEVQIALIEKEFADIRSDTTPDERPEHVN
jgi:hypothetical protein